STPSALTPPTCTRCPDPKDLLSLPWCRSLAVSSICPLRRSLRATWLKWSKYLRACPGRFSSCFLFATMRGGLVILLFAAACAGPRAAPRSEPLYFAVEMFHAGKRIGAPHLLGFTGHQVTAERRAPGALQADYRLVL